MVLLPALGALVLLLTVPLAFLDPPPAFAQSVQAAVDDLRDFDVTFEEGAISDADLQELDEAAARLQNEAGVFKVVVLSKEVSDFSSTDAFAEEVLAGLGEEGRVLVYTPDTAAVATTVDPENEAAQAETAAIRRANESDSFAQGALAAGQLLLGGDLPPAAEGPSEGIDSGGSEGGGLFSLWWLFGLGGLVLLIFLWWSGTFRTKSSYEEVEAEALGRGEAKVREAVNRGANAIIKLDERVNLPDSPRAAQEDYREGSRLFMAIQGDLEEADTRPELEAVYPRVLEAIWYFDSAEARLEGREPPPKPEPESLFPRGAIIREEEATATGRPESPAQVPKGSEQSTTRTEDQRHYRDYDESPWLTDAATIAMRMLMSRWGWGGYRSYRRPMGDDDFGRNFGGGGIFGGGQSRGGSWRPRINIGGGRGMGSRGGGGGRGMGRR